MAHPLALSRFFHRVLPACLLALAACVPEVELPGDAEACAGLRCYGGQCVSNAGQPMCRCGDWEETAGLNCELGGAAEQDDHGASPADATELTLPMTKHQGLIGSLGRGGVRDLDLFAFTAEDRHLYSFSCGGGTLVNCRVRLRDEYGNLTPVSGESRQGVLTVYATLPAGRWFLEVSHDSQSGTYLYQLLDLGPDDHGDVPATATPLPAPGVPVTVTHTAAFDWDVFTFRAEPERQYRVSCQPEGPGTWESRSWELRLTSQAGTLRNSYAGRGVADPPGKGSVAYTPAQAEDLAVFVRVESFAYPAYSVCVLEAP